MAKSRKANSTRERNGPATPSDFRATLWAAAQKLRGNMDAAKYKHVALGLIFLKYISDRFEELRAKGLADWRKSISLTSGTSMLATTSSGCPRPLEYLKANATSTDPTIGAQELCSARARPE